ncbi:hypothetical protein J5069_08475 [Candidatus Symbiopectobacterium sp. NZEC127]|uniref:phage tail fiber protein n=1 Tax=Candidatus Symbiopectobacterium sp. NZEC127 TaxID=2820472 RepID=UPI0022265806|nr:hypothetical protein [Candidatus Symbiopectobacterium sp. NZEC127]MCW2485928.1 hypothetical protein [Candidatus Symbiopectobacterium sp. NZEC127]
MKAWYTTGTIAVVQGTKSIVGTGTAWKQDINGIGRGHALIISTANGDRIYEIDRVDDDNHIVSVSNVKEATASGLSYAIVNFMPSTLPDFGRKLSVQLSDYQTFFDSFQQLATGTGNVTLTAPDGTQVTVRSQQAWDAALDGKVTGVKQDNSTDFTANRILALSGTNGSFGLGGNTVYLTETTDLHVYLKSAKTGFYAGNTVIVNGINSSSHNYFWQKYNDNYGTLIATPIGNNALPISVKTLVNGVWSGWKTLWDTANLVKQTSSLDSTAGSTMIAGAEGSFGLGSLSAPLLPITTTLAASLATARSGLYRVPAGTAGSPNTSYGWYFLVTRFSTASAGVLAYTADVGNQRIAQGNFNNGVFNGWVDIWNSLNLVKQTGQFDATAGSIMLNGAWGWGGLGEDFTRTSADFLTWVRSAANGSRIFRNVTDTPYTQPYGASIVIKSVDTWGVLSIGYGSSSGVRVSGGNASGSNTITHNLWTDKNLVKQVSAFDATAGSVMLNGAWGWGGLGSQRTFATEAEQIAFMNSATNGSQLFRPSTFTGGAESTLLKTYGPAILFKTGDTWAAISVGHHGTGSAVTQRRGVKILAGTQDGPIPANYELWTDQNLPNPATLDTAQTISGVKKFTASPIISATNATVSLEASGFTESSVGRWSQLTNNGGITRLFIRAGSGGNPTSTGERVLTFPSSASGTILASGNNAVADSNGFWKTASPVVKLYADGTSELTSEAEGITTERLSEGVYRISGCLGLNADLAWGGIEGGISCPKCRNGLERVWNDYDVEADGSIVIRTYHRPHPDAPAFARNEIEGYASGDPIDIPRDTFISVRVQMPEREEEKPKVMHSNVYCNTVAG